MKSNLDKLFKTNHDAEANGVWFMINDELGFRVRRFSEANPAMQQVMSKFFKPYARQLELGTLSAEKSREVMTRVFVHGCLVDWQGVEIDGQASVPFSKEKAVELLIALPDLFKTLMDYAQKIDSYKEETEDLGNS